MSEICTYLCTDDGDSRSNLAAEGEGNIRRRKSGRTGQWMERDRAESGGEIVRRQAGTGP